MGNHDTVKELDSLVQQAQLRADVKSNRGSRNCAESRNHSFTSASEKFLQDKPSAIMHSEGTLPNHGQQPRTEIAPRCSPQQRLRSSIIEQPETRQVKAPSLSMKCSQREPRMRWDQVQRNCRNDGLNFVNVTLGLGFCTLRPRMGYRRC